jgi:hypothetical protein
MGSLALVPWGSGHRVIGKNSLDEWLLVRGTLSMLFWI